MAYPATLEPNQPASDRGRPTYDSRMLRRLLPLLAVWVLAAPAAAHAQSPPCLAMDPPPPGGEPQPLRFGITPGIAGSAGADQGTAKPVDPQATVDALGELRTGRRELVLRLNRLFWADGRAGIERFARQVDFYAAAGLRSEIQVRYHPPEGREGDIAAWERFVRRAVRELGRRPSVVGFSITNEANLPISPNTSDGAYEGVVDALVRGVVVARQELRAMGRPRLDLGFNVMWRWYPQDDERFWREIGEKATPAFRRALDYVGVQVYPHLVWPPSPLPGRSAGREVVEAVSLVRDCYMPMAGMGREVDVWVSENGYATNLGRTESGQAQSLESTLADVHAYSNDLGITDYRYFNLRDNDSTTGTDMFDAVGVLRDDYSRKPAFYVLRGAIARTGAARQRTSAPSPRLRVQAVRRGRRVVVRGEARPCRGWVDIRVRGAGIRTVRCPARVRGSTCRFRSEVVVGNARRLRVQARFRGITRNPPVRRAR
jgi:hypothetical protein